MPIVSSLRSRPYATRDDLRAIQAPMSAAWASPHRPFIPGTVGDLEWWTASAGPDADWPSRIRLWELGGDVIGWGWFQPPSGLDWFVVGSLSPAEEGAVRGEILDWLAERARHARSTSPPQVGVGRPAGPIEPIELEAWAADGWSEAAILAGRGWRRTETALSQLLQPLDVELDPLRLPDGYVVRSVRGPDEIAARVDVHRAAFAPSRMTVEKYRVLLEQDHYAFDHDLVVEAPDGSFAAFAMCWIDPVGSIGEFEPVGTHPDHQRRGLGRVVLRHGLRLMRAAGLGDALVFSLISNAASEALYRSAGFERVALHRQYTLAIDP